MSKLIFLNIPAYGHTNPTLPIVKELVDRGEEVIYYSFEDFKEKIEQTGAKYRTYNIDISSLNEEELTTFPILLDTLMKSTKEILEQIIPEIEKEKPDYIIHDSLCIWGKYVAEILGIPAICSNTTFAFSKSFINVPKELLSSIPQLIKGELKYLTNGLKTQKELCTKYEIKKHELLDVMKNEEPLNLVYTSKDFQPKGYEFSENYKFVGPSIGDRKESTLSLSQKCPVIYISLGTIFGDNKEFYENCFTAFGGMNVTCVMSLGNKFKKENFDYIPDNFIVMDYVPQISVLKQASVFITHAGMNSVQEGLYFKVPLITYPQQKEQQMVAEQVEKTGCGIYLRKVTPILLKESVEDILSNTKYKKNCKQMSLTLKDAGGYKKAVEEIFNFLKCFQK